MTYTYRCPSCDATSTSGKAWLAHMVMEHDGATTTQMRKAGISGNPSQRRAEAEETFGIQITTSTPHTRPNGRTEAIYTLTPPPAIRALRESPEPSMYVHALPGGEWPVVAFHQALPGESADELVQRVCNDFHRAERARLKDAA